MQRGQGAGSGVRGAGVRQGSGPPIQREPVTIDNLNIVKLKRLGLGMEMVHEITV